MDSIYLNFPFFTQGNSIYAEIPASEAERHSSTLEEGKIYIMSRFRVCNATNYCKSLPGPYMLEITCHTRINLARETATFPEYGYFLTPFDEIPGYIGDKKKFHGNHLYYLNHKNQLEQLSRNNSICFMLMYLASLFKSMNQNGFILLTKQRLHCEGTLSLEMTSTVQQHSIFHNHFGYIFNFRNSHAHTTFLLVMLF